ncbi:MAG: hypothetical protein WD872_19380 [Pirellulaceae bacterium]
METSLPPAPAPAPAVEPVGQRPQKLAIVHLLGWTLGVAAVLGLYRAVMDLSGLPAEWQLGARLSQLGFGLAYGTALAGMGLFVWRWARGIGPGPSQPGHWLLVLGGVGLLTDIFTIGAIQAASLVGKRAQTR